MHVFPHSPKRSLLHDLSRALTIRSVMLKNILQRGSVLGRGAMRLRTGLWVVCLLVVIGGCQILPGHWRPGWNERLPAGAPVPDTAGSWKLTELEQKDGRFVALAISGGGSRAANF